MATKQRVGRHGKAAARPAEDARIEVEHDRSDTSVDDLVEFEDDGLSTVAIEDDSDDVEVEPE
ncbi:MAG TPA: hypothetical protein V6C72_17325, partial [Chroococcales cyanobacterium]